MYNCNILHFMWKNTIILMEVNLRFELTIWWPLDTRSCPVDPQNDQARLPGPTLELPHIGISILYINIIVCRISIYITDFFPYLNVTLIMIIMQYNHVLINDIMLKYMFMCHVPVNQQLSVLHNISSVTTVKPENEKQYSWIDFHSCLFYIPSFLDD